MPFTDWIFGYGASKAADRAIGAFRRDPLVVDLDTCVDEWRAQLPKRLALPESAALFPSHLLDMQLDEGSALLALRQSIHQNQLPNPTLWAAALIEQWHVMRTNNRHGYALFDAPEAEVTPHLTALANQLHQTAARHVKLFNPEVLRLLLALRSDIATMQPARSLQDMFGTWAALVHRLTPDYHRAMAEGAAWPGELWAEVEREYVLYLQLYGALAVHTQSAEIAAKDLNRFRETPTAALSEALAIRIEEAATRAAPTPGGSDASAHRQ